LLRALATGSVRAASATSSATGAPAAVSSAGHRRHSSRAWCSPARNAPGAGRS